MLPGGIDRQVKAGRGYGFCASPIKDRERPCMKQIQGDGYGFYTRAALAVRGEVHPSVAGKMKILGYWALNSLLTCCRVHHVKHIPSHPSIRYPIHLLALTSAALPCSNGAKQPSG